MRQLPYHAIADKEISSDDLTVPKELLRLLCIPEIFGPGLRGARPRSARLDLFDAFPEPPFTHWGPAPDIDTAALPSGELGPPRKVPRLLSLSCLRVSTV